MSNFEAKHPRATDGKFTEKNRAESGLTLELEQFGKMPHLDTPKTCYRGNLIMPPVESTKQGEDGAEITNYQEVNLKDLGENDWALQQKVVEESGTEHLVFRTKNDLVREDYDPNGTLAQQSHFPPNHDVFRSKMPTEARMWWTHGALLSTYASCTEEEIAALEPGGGPLTEKVKYDPEGSVASQTFYQNRNGQIEKIEAKFDHDGNVLRARRIRK